MTNSPFIPGESCSVDASPVTIGPGFETQPGQADNQPKVNVIREGADVKFIEIQCTCGKITRVVCEY